MDQIIDLIFENPFFLVLIIGALMSFFGDNKKEKTKESEQPRVEKSRVPEANKPVIEEVKPIPERQHQSVQEKEQSPKPQLSIEEHRANQMVEYMSKNMRSMDLDKQEDMMTFQDNKSLEEIEGLLTSYQNNDFQRELKRSLTPEGLVNSIIMSEILGPPRSKKPHQSMNIQTKLNK